MPQVVVADVGEFSSQYAWEGKVQKYLQPAQVTCF